MEITQAEQAAVSVAASPAERAALALNSSQTERDLRELATKHASIQAIKDKAGRDQAHGAAMEVKRARTTIERVGKEARDDATKFSKAVIAEQNRLTAIIEPEEQRLLTLRDTWDTEQEKAREAAAAAERFRVEQIQGRIDAIKGFEGMARNCRTSGAVQRLADALEKVDLTGLQEFEDQTLHIYGEVKGAVNQILTQLQADEAERARIKAEQEAEASRLAAERAELERQRIEAAAKAREEADRIAAERAEIERQRIEAAARANAEADRIAQERAALEAARIEFEQRQRAHEERERAERVAREAEQAAAAQATADAADSARRALEVAELAKPVFIDEDGDVPLIADLSATPEFIEAASVTEEAPSALDLILAIAEANGVDPKDARDWLVLRAADIAAIEL